jgi:hypothetical protein
MPISGYTAFDNKGLPYDAHAIFTNGSFDVEKYKAYSPLFLSTTFTMSIGASCALFTTLIIHTLCACSSTALLLSYADSGRKYGIGKTSRADSRGLSRTNAMFTPA